MDDEYVLVPCDDGLEARGRLGELGFGSSEHG
jgi:hypothetical protein